MIETTDINNAAERRDIITKYGMLEQAYSEITFCWQETSEKGYPWQQDHLAGEQELLLELIRPVHRNIMLSGSFFMPEGCVPGSGSGRNTEIFRSV